MRTRLPLSLLLVCAFSAAGVQGVAASTDCDQWLKQYKDELANAAPVQHLKHHILHHLHRKPQIAMAIYIPPVHRPVMPKLTPAEMLRRFHILCDTPDNQADLPPAPVPNFLMAPPDTPTEISTLMTPQVPGQTPPSHNTTTTESTPPSFPGTPGIPGGLGTSFTPPPDGGVGGAPVPPVPPVPEPSSLVLLLTGAAGLLVRRSLVATK